MWLGELGGADVGATVELLGHVEADRSEAFNNMLAASTDTNRDLCWHTMRNLAATIYGAFNGGPFCGMGDNFSIACTEAAARVKGVYFSPELALRLHGCLMQGLMSDTDDALPGAYRTGHRQAKGSILYDAPEYIPKRVEALFEHTLAAMPAVDDDSPETVAKVLRVAACFFRCFLLIHPFGDGNGRTARVLLSILLREYTLVPLSLYVCEGRTPCDDYIAMLEQCPPGEFPEACIDYIFHCAVSQARRVVRASLKAA